MASLHSIIAVLVSIIGIVVTYRMAAVLLVARADRRAARDQGSGVLVGAEDIDLGPVDSARAVLLVHGFIGAANNFGDLPGCLADAGWRVRVLRLPGHGTSPRDLGHVDAAQLVGAVIAELGVLRSRHRFVALVGHSMGGTLAVSAAARLSVDALVLLAPYFGAPRHVAFLGAPERWACILAPVAGWLPRLRAFVQVNRREVVNSIVSYRWLPLGAVGFLVDTARIARYPDVLAAITCPVLHIHAVRDRAADCVAATKAVDAMSRARITRTLLSRSNHILMWDHERDRARDDIMGFLDAHATGI